MRHNLRNHSRVPGSDVFGMGNVVKDINRHNPPELPRVQHLLDPRYARFMDIIVPGHADKVALCGEVPYLPDLGRIR